MPEENSDNGTLNPYRTAMISTENTPISWAHVFASVTGKLLTKIGAIEVLLLLVALFSGVVRKFLPEVGDEVSKTVYELFHQQIGVNQILSNLLLFSLGLMVTLLVLKVLGETILNILKRILLVMKLLISMVLELFIIFGKFLPKTDSLRQLSAQWRDKIRYISEKLYTNPVWEAEGGQAGIFNLPIDVQNFQSFECDVDITYKPQNYWRAGITFGKKGEDRYIFHFYEDTPNPGVLKFRAFTKKANQTITDSRKVVSRSSESSQFTFKLIKIGTDRIELLLNNRTVGIYDLSFGDLDKAYVAAWGDGRPYKIYFRNIKAVTNVH